MAIRTRLKDKSVAKPDRECTLYELVRKRSEEGHGALIICCYHNRWQVSMSRPNDNSRNAVEVGQPGQPIEDVIWNCAVMQPADRKHFKSGDNVIIAETPPSKKLLIRPKPRVRA